MVDFRAYLRNQLQFTHGTLEQVVADLDPDTLHHRYPGSTANHIAAIYAHAVTAEDGIVNGLVLGRMPIFNPEIAEKTVLPESPRRPRAPRWRFGFGRPLQRVDTTLVLP